MLPLEGDEGTKEPVVDGWRKTLMNHINNPNHSTDKKVWHQAMKYTLVDGKLYRRTTEAAHKMKWTLRRAGVFWPTMLKECFDYYKGCESC
jgi:hypothetical protein